ncbi:inositol polyphosphate phosphatase (predicted) [Sugiyamaella lignohabitans]|uniref:Inositol polyphosphate phosphatase (Predicted) n=1 Tax=Sugiyamaella lignohabitans TaxID=796027 RepID=A0A167CMJ6_9ASCO|nr:inositol polyphosphate phosphatase (predicted) [Sugiyamaella lignohabitans]ANB11890.1 inositol polyphosphate phosphatase (predicted) [Sugiyamaella lignohabitans]
MADHSSLPSVNNVKARFEQMAAAEADLAPGRSLKYSLSMPVGSSSARNDAGNIKADAADARSKSVSVVPDNSIQAAAVAAPLPKKLPPGAPPKPARLSSQHKRISSVGVSQSASQSASQPAVLAAAQSGVGLGLVSAPGVPATPSAPSAATPDPSAATEEIQQNTVNRQQSQHARTPSSLLMPPPASTSRTREGSVTPPIPPPPRIRTPVDFEKSPSQNMTRSPIRTPPTPPLPRSRTPIENLSLAPHSHGHGPAFGLRSPSQPSINTPPMLPPRPSAHHSIAGIETSSQNLPSISHSPASPVAPTTPISGISVSSTPVPPPVPPVPPHSIKQVASHQHSSLHHLDNPSHPVSQPVPETNNSSHAAAGVSATVPPTTPYSHINNSLQQFHINGGNDPSASYPNIALQQTNFTPPILPPRPVRSVSPQTALGQSPSLSESFSATTTLHPPALSVATTPSTPAMNPSLPPANLFPPPPQTQITQHLPTPIVPAASAVPTPSTAPAPTSTPISDSDNETELYSNPNTSNTSLAAGSEYAYYSFPDSSQASRRPPIFEGVLHSIQLSSKKEEGKKTISTFGKHACVSGGSTTCIYDTQTGGQIWSLSHSEVRITSIGYKSDDGHTFWLGTKDGQIWEISLTDIPGTIPNKRANTHLNSIILIYKNEQTNEMWTLSEDGKLCVWSECDLFKTPKTFRVTPNFKAVGVAGSTLWVGRNRQIFVYQPSSQANVPFLLTARPIQASAPVTPAAGGLQPSPSSASLSSMNGYKPPPANGTTASSNSNNLIGDFTCAANVGSIPDHMFFGHDNGCISVYSVSQLAFIDAVSVSMNKISSMCGVGDNLWIGLKTGTILVCDAKTTPWTVRKEWKAHDTAVASIACFDDLDISQVEGMLPVISTSLAETSVALWDGLLKHDWIGKFTGPLASGGWGSAPDPGCAPLRGAAGTVDERNDSSAARGAAGSGAEPQPPEAESPLRSTNRSRNGFTGARSRVQCS